MSSPLRTRYVQVYDNVPMTFDSRKWMLKLQCCDCALVHDVYFKVIGEHKVEFKFNANRAETARARRRAKKSKV